MGKKVAGGRNTDPVQSGTSARDHAIPIDVLEQVRTPPFGPGDSTYHVLLHRVRYCTTIYAHMKQGRVEGQSMPARGRLAYIGTGEARHTRGSGWTAYISVHEQQK